MVSKQRAFSQPGTEAQKPQKRRDTKRERRPMQKIVVPLQSQAHGGGHQARQARQAGIR